MSESQRNGKARQALQVLDQGYQRVVMDIPEAEEAAKLLDLTVGSVALLPGQLLLHQRIQLAMAEHERALEVIDMYQDINAYERFKCMQLVEKRLQKIISYLTQ